MKKTAQITLAFALMSSLMTPAMSTASTVLSDDFNDNSGGVPAGWTLVPSDPNGTAVESGGVVTITDSRGNGGPTPMASSTNFNPLPDPSAVLTYTLNIASMSGTPGEATPQSLWGLGGSAGTLLVQFDSVSRSFGLFFLSSTFGFHPFPVVPGPHLPSYAGGSLPMQLVADQDSFRVTSTLGSESFDSGNVLFSAAGAPGFDSLDDFGSSAGPVLLAEASGNVEGQLASVAYDSILIDVTVPEPASLGVLGAAATLVSRRRRANRPNSD